VARLLAVAPPSPRVVDLAAGTGHLARAAGPRGRPRRGCRAKPRHAEGVCGAYPRHEGGPGRSARGSDVSAGAAELVLLADAAHWVDPEASGKEAHRLLAAGGTAGRRRAASWTRPSRGHWSPCFARPTRERRPQGRAVPANGSRWRAAVPACGRLSSRKCVVLTPDMAEGVLGSLYFLAPAPGPAGGCRPSSRRAGRWPNNSGGARWETVLRLSWAGKSVGQEG
jgi:hypothetical protein